MKPYYSHLPLQPTGGEHFRGSDAGNGAGKLFDIRRLEQEEELLWENAPSKLHCFEVLWIREGKGSLWVDEHAYELGENMIFCLAPGRFRKSMLEPGTVGYYLSFAPEFIWLSGEYPGMSVWLDQYSNNTRLAFIRADDASRHEFEAIVRKMEWEYVHCFNRKLELLKGLLNVFLIYFSRSLGELTQKALPSREAELVRRFMNILKKNFISQKMVSDYARQLCVTSNYLNRAVKKTTGFTVSHHIQQQIILEAKRRAIYSSVSMKEIAYYLGFDNLAHFSKFFKNNCGMSFTDFRKVALRPG